MPNPKTNKNTLSEYLAGEKALWKAFWLLYISGNILIALLYTLLLKSPAFIELAHYISMQTKLSPGATLIIIIAAMTTPTIGYFIICFAAIWKCAKNTSKKAWSVLAKFIVTLHAAWVTLKILTASASIVNYFS